LSKTPDTDPRPAEDASSDLTPLPFTSVFAFVGSGCLLVIEIVAGRLIAPNVGVSLYTWTSVIGVVLAGLAIGNYLGGKLADRRPGRTTLSAIYLAAAATSALILFFARDVDAFTAPTSWPAILQVLWITTLMFFVPSIVLGMPTPMLVKLSLPSLDSTGRVVGDVQAAATAGSILGVFLTGYFLITWFGTRAIVAGVVVVLLLLAAFSHPYLTDTSRVARAVRSQPALAIVPVVVLVAALTLAMTADSKCIKESNYFCIDVGPDATGVNKELRLDLLIHGVVNPDNPAQLIYPYEKLYQQVTEASFPKGGRISSFQIGGGTYSFPRYLAANYDADSFVAEIDPKVTEVVRSHLGLRDSPEIEIQHEDARLALRERPGDERYDLVLGDAFNDIAVPYHLTTKEFNEMVADHLSQRGIYLINVVDGKDYDFLRSFMKTLTQTFRNVGLMTVPGQAVQGERATFVVVASQVPLPRLQTIVGLDRLQPFFQEKDTVELTDDHVPVDQLLAPVYGDSLEEHDQPAEGE
jgi:predicted membrane-bound spermidine synthase